MVIFSAYSAAITPLNAEPTTLAGVTIWNGEPAGGKVYIIDSLFTIMVVSQGVATSLQLFEMVNIGAIAKPTGGVAVTPRGQNGQAYSASGNANVQSGLTVTNDIWYPWGSSIVIQNTAHVFTAQDMPVVHGEIILNPGFAMSIHGVVSNAPVAASIKCGFTWYEANAEEGRALQ
jgi:hypothetical protein